MAKLNSRIRCSGLSSRELITQRSQFTNEQLPLSDQKLIADKQAQRTVNHSYSEKSKLGNRPIRKLPHISIGDLVYLHSDRNKFQSRNRYIVVNMDGECFIKKFTGCQLRAKRIKLS